MHQADLFFTIQIPGSTLACGSNHRRQQEATYLGVERDRRTFVKVLPENSLTRSLDQVERTTSTNANTLFQGAARQGVSDKACNIGFPFRKSNKGTEAADFTSFPFSTSPYSDDELFSTSVPWIVSKLEALSETTFSRVTQTLRLTYGLCWTSSNSLVNHIREPG